MRSLMIAMVAAAGIALAGTAQAATFGSASGLRVAIEELNPIDEVRHRCFRTRRGLVCPSHGWRRHYWRPRYRHYRRW